MRTRYASKEDIEEFYTPNLDVVWPGVDGCSDHHYTRGERSVGAGSVTYDYYDPEAIVEIKDNRHISGRRPSYPPFRFTPYNVSKVTYREFLCRRKNGTNGYNMWEQHGLWTKQPTVCYPSLTETIESGPKTARWTDVSRDYPYTNYTINSFDTNEVANAKSKAENEVAIEALRSYDFLTDLAEAREIPSMVTSITRDIINITKLMRGRFDLFTLRSAARLTIVDLLKHPYRTMRKLGDWWMTYRYGIMPLAYSYRDILKSINRGICNTSRKYQVVQPRPTGVSLPGSGSHYKWTETDGDIRINATVFQYFELRQNASFSSLGLNPLATAWELIPYSFVLDWFVNVGDYITRRTSLPTSKWCWACISQRSNYRTYTYVHFPEDNKTITFGNVKTSPWVGSQPPATPSEVIQRPEESQLYSSVEVDAYDRTLFALNDAKLVVAPSLNWKRLLDSAVMALNQLRRLRRF